MWSHSRTLDDLVVPYAIDPRIAAAGVGAGLGPAVDGDLEDGSM
ncbi:hypothetical protein OG883_41580 [Streptomyces sp. NBC_01142]|nr:hypothetical protein [Streptomyces sp. NBC_01142]MCX4826165.1 hypothetical protein [Streptomyces sp. NBC_01142]